MTNPSVRYMLTAKQLTAINAAISRPRLTTFVHATHGNARRGLDLYAWNASSSAALWPVLHMNEIVLRNAISATLERVYGPSWPFSPTFEQSLPKREKDQFVRQRGETVAKITKKKKRPVSTGDLIASQTYQFWVSFLTSRHDGRLWHPHLKTSFPHLPPGVGRDVIHERADAIRRFRNRVAHHEPILVFQLPTIYRSLTQLIAWVCPTTEAWVTREWPQALVVQPRSLIASRR